ncbi:MAG: sulfotransferase domain-containing protein [Thermoanaerobaculia bacterium]
MSAAAEADARKPDFFIAGAARCGTTSMYLYLKQHPEIYVSVLKEPHFFARDLTRPPQGIRDERVYLDLFAAAGDEKRLGEASVWYLSSRTAPRDIAAFSPHARILIMLRDPVEMLHSLWSLYLRTGNEELQDFAAAVDAAAERRAGRRLPATTYFPEGLQYLEVGRYSEKVARWLDTFSRGRVKVILFEDFRRNTPAVYRDTLEFLEVDPAFQPEYDLAKATRLVRDEVLRQLRRVPPEIRFQMRGSGRNHTSRERRPYPAELRERLRRDLSADIQALGALLGRDLSNWSGRAS